MLGYMPLTKTISGETNTGRVVQSPTAKCRLPMEADYRSQMTCFTTDWHTSQISCHLLFIPCQCLFFLFALPALVFSLFFVSIPSLLLLLFVACFAFFLGIVLLIFFLFSCSLDCLLFSFHFLFLLLELSFLLSFPCFSCHCILFLYKDSVGLSLPGPLWNALPMLKHW